MVSRAAIEKLIKAGAFDSLAPGKRAALFDALPRALEAAGQLQVDRRHGQGGLFDAFESAEPPPDEGLRDVTAWTSSECLKFEKEALDFYITSHPLAQHEAVIRLFSMHTIQQLSTLPPETEVFLGGMITQIRPMNTKKRPQRQLPLCSLPSRGLDRLGGMRHVARRLPSVQGSIRGRCSPLRQRDRRTQPRRAGPAVDAHSNAGTRPARKDHRAALVAELAQHRPELLDEVARVLQRWPGTCPVFLYIQDEAGRWLRLKAADSFKINPGSTQVKSELEVLLPGRVEFRERAAMAMGGDYRRELSYKMSTIRAFHICM